MALIINTRVGSLSINNDTERAVVQASYDLAANHIIMPNDSSDISESIEE